MHQKLSEIYGLFYFPGQWFIYCLDERTRYCQLDGILYFPAKKLLLIVEVKYNHTADAYWQMENLYLPVMKSWLADKTIEVATVEVVKWFDPAVQCPKKPTLRAQLDEVKPNEFAVHILNRE